MLRLVKSKKSLPTTKNKRKAALIPLRLGLYGGQRNLPFLYKTTDEAALRLLKTYVSNNYQMRTRTLFMLILTIALTSCKSFLKVVPIPEHPNNVDEELKYIFKTDQKDRKRILLKVLFQPEEKYMKNYKVLAVSNRDSIRLSRVIYLDTNNLILSDQAKFHSGIIYLHTGGIKMADNSLYLRRSSELFEYLMKNATTKKLKKRGETYYQEAQNRIKWNQK